MANQGSRAAGLGLLVAAAVGGLAPAALAADLGSSPDSLGALSPQGQSHQPTRDYDGLPIGNWILYPSALVGVIFDDNIKRTQTNKTSGAGLRVAPSFRADLDNGIHQTSVYGAVDARLYPGAASSVQVDAQGGFKHTWTPERDLLFTFQVDYTRVTDIFGSGINASKIQVFAPPPSSAIVNFQPYNQFTGSASVQKTFGPAFFALGGTVQHIAYDKSSGTGTDGTTYSLAARAGYWVTPTFYGYAEPTVSASRYSSGLLDSNAYRIVGGIGSDRIGLFKGEVYGGYQTDHYDHLTTRTADGAVFGGKLYYYPTRFWTFSGSLDATFGSSSAAGVVGTAGTPTRGTTALVSAEYALSQFWSADARFGYTRLEYVGISRTDSAWLAEATLNYSFWRNLTLTLDYQFTKSSSNVPVGRYTRNMITAGATYKY